MEKKKYMQISLNYWQDNVYFNLAISSYNRISIKAFTFNFN